MNAWIEIRSLRNVATGTDLFPQGFSSLEVAEFSANTLIVQFPAATKMSLGVLVAVDCLLHFADGSPKEFPVMVKIAAVDYRASADAGAHVRTTLELRQYDAQLWQRYLLKVSEAQSKVDALFRKMKGDPE